MKKNSTDNNKIQMAKEISTALQNGEELNANSLGISQDKIAQLKNILNDKQTMERIMESDTAKSILKKFSEEG